MMALAMRGFIAVVIVLCILVSSALVRLANLPVAAAIGASLALTLVIHSLIVAAGFVLAWWRSRAPDARTPPGWLKAWPGEISISLRNMYLDIPFRHRWPRRVPANSRGAVLLVHGYGCNRGVWQGYDTWLASLGWAVDAVNLSPPTASIDVFGRQVAEAARALASETGHRDVVVIAHSMGGLSARAALRADPGTPIRHVITVATPHLGTFHAHVGPGVCSTEMVPDCLWLTGLRSGEPADLAARFTCIATRHDNIVSPMSCAILPGATAFTLERLGHMQLLHDPRVRAYLARRLEDLLPAPHGAA